MTDGSALAAAERLALVLAQSGMQRMAARVMCALLYAEQETTTAGELSERLEASAGAVSGALKMLVGLSIVERMPSPAGDRRDHYRFRPDGWTVMTESRNQLLDVMQQHAREGVEAAGPESIAGRRLAEMRDFYAYMQRELPAILQRWRDERDGRTSTG